MQQKRGILGGEQGGKLAKDGLHIPECHGQNPEDRQEMGVSQVWSSHSARFGALQV